MSGRTFGIVTGAVVGTCSLLVMGFIVGVLGIHAAACWEAGKRESVATRWDPFSGCTVRFLGTDVRVGP